MSGRLALELHSPRSTKASTVATLLACPGIVFRILCNRSKSCQNHSPVKMLGTHRGFMSCTIFGTRYSHIARIQGGGIPM